MSDSTLIRSTWEKTLSNGAKETSSIQGLESGKDSWTKGKQDIVNVKLTLGEKSIEIACKDAQMWKQYDNYLYSSIHNQSILASAEIRCKPKHPVSLTYDKSSGSKFVLKKPKGKEPPVDGWISFRLLPDGRFTVYVHEE